MLEWLFGKREKTYPILKSEMFQPIDNKIGTAEAKKLFREWMLKIGYLEKDEVGDHVGYFADEIREEEDFLKSEVTRFKDELKDDVAQAKQDLKELKQQLKNCKTPEERAQLEQDIADLENEAANPDNSFLIEAQQALDAFKADKRGFLINAINTQVHGGDWRNKT
jgi:hypothetical protein